MGFRTLEINNAAEIHIKEGQLQVKMQEGVALIPIEDLTQIMVHGANIRLSTMDLSILAQYKVSITTLDEKYLPTAIVLPFEGHSRQAKLMHAQVSTSKDLYLNLWMQIITRKISNQARVEDPINSRLNYGYAVVRSAIARNLVAVGFYPTFGIHHDSQLNTFNLADDLIEPFRPMVDLVAHDNIGPNLQLNKNERKAMAHVLHNASTVDGVKVNVLTSIDMMCKSLKRIILNRSEEKLQLPIILPVESMEGVTE